MPKKIWDNYKLIGEIRKAPSTVVRVELVARDGVKYLRLHEWYKKQTETVWKPGAANMAIPINLEIMNDITDPAAMLLTIMSAAIDAANSFELEDDNNAVYQS